MAPQASGGFVSDVRAVSHALMRPSELSSSFEVFAFPPKLGPGHAFLVNLAQAWERVGLGRLLLNSSFIALTVAMGKICLAVMAAFAFTYFRDFPGKNACFVIILITHMLPLPVRIVPTFQLMETLGWVNSYQALTVPFFASATGTLLFRQFFLTMPPALSEAARVDGAGPLVFLVRIRLRAAMTTAPFSLDSTDKAWIVNAPRASGQVP